MTNQLQIYPACKPSDIRLLDGGINGFLRHEMLTYAPDAKYDQATSFKTGYEISFTRHFYKPMPMSPLEEIRPDILVLEKETGGVVG